ncbi:YkgJ family cysteine cluster protein [Acidobacteriota bacterium]
MSRNEMHLPIPLQILEPVEGIECTPLDEADQEYLLVHRPSGTCLKIGITEKLFLESLLNHRAGLLRHCALLEAQLEHPITYDIIEDLAKQLLDLGFLRPTSSTLPITVLEGTRFACRQCGKCCRGREIGPVEPSLVQTLISHDFGEDYPLLAGGERFYLKHEGGISRYYVRTANEACIFLDTDNLCIIQNQLGWGSKPAPCRVFPVRLVLTETALLADATHACNIYPQMLKRGPLLEDDPWMFVEPSAVCRPVILPSNPVRISANLSIPHQTYLSLETSMLKWIDQMKEPAGLILERLATLFSSWLQKTKEPSDWNGLLLDQDLPPPPLPDRYSQASTRCNDALIAVLEKLRKITAQPSGEKGRDDPANHPDRAIYFASLVFRVLHGIDILGKKDLPEMPEWFHPRRYKFTWPGRDAHSEILRDQMKRFIFSKRCLEYADLLSGLGFMALSCLATVSCTSLLTLAKGRRKIRLEELGEGSSMIWRTLSRDEIRTVLQEAPLSELFLNYVTINRKA